jgi:hypothetical protein
VVISQGGIFRHGTHLSLGREKLRNLSPEVDIYAERQKEYRRSA